MLEAENTRYSGYSRYPTDRWFYEGKCIGYRQSSTEIMCRIYLGKDSFPPETTKLLEDRRDMLDEIDRFYRKYGKLSEEKIAQHLIAESEYLIGLYTYTDQQE